MLQNKNKLIVIILLALFLASSCSSYKIIHKKEGSIYNINQKIIDEGKFLIEYKNIKYPTILIVIFNVSHVSGLKSTYFIYKNKIYRFWGESSDYIFDGLINDCEWINDMQPYNYKKIPSKYLFNGPCFECSATHYYKLKVDRNKHIKIIRHKNLSNDSYVGVSKEEEEYDE